MKNDVMEAIDSERKYQIQKWGDVNVRSHEVGAWITLMRAHLDRAQNDWASSNGNATALAAIRKVIALGVACGEQHGLPKR